MLSVREKQPVGTTVARVVATDPDLDENSTLRYTFNKGNQLAGACSNLDLILLARVKNVPSRAD